MRNKLGISVVLKQAVGTWNLVQLAAICSVMLEVSMVSVHHKNKHDDDDGDDDDDDDDKEEEDTWDELWKCTGHISRDVQHKGALLTWHFSSTHFKHWEWVCMKPGIKSYLSCEVTNYKNCLHF